MSSSRLTLISAIVVVSLIVIGIGGYFLVIKVDKQHKENVENLSEFGIKVIPIRGGGSDTVTIGVGGQVQLPPSIAEKKLSPTEKIIISLSKEKEQLIAELTTEKEKLAKLTEEVEILRNYYQENERYAPTPINEEKLRIKKLLTEYFAKSNDAARFTSFQRNSAILSATDMYEQLLRKYRLALSEEKKKTILDQHLPAYGFCVADGIPFVANSPSEERMLLSYFDSGDRTLLKGHLAEDLDQVKKPCVASLNERLNSLI